MRAWAAGAAAATLLLAGCTGAPAPSPSSTSSTTCAGDPSADKYTLNLNATPPREIDGAQVSADSVGVDAEGPYGAVTVKYEDAQVTQTDLRVGGTVDLGARSATVTHICVVTALPSPMPPGTSRGSIGLD